MMKRLLIPLKGKIVVENFERFNTLIKEGYHLIFEYSQTQKKPKDIFILKFKFIKENSPVFIYEKNLIISTVDFYSLARTLDELNSTYESNLFRFCLNKDNVFLDIFDSNEEMEHSNILQSFPIQLEEKIHEQDIADFCEKFYYADFRQLVITSSHLLLITLSDLTGEDQTRKFKISPEFKTKFLRSTISNFNFLNVSHRDALEFKVKLRFAQNGEPILQFIILKNIDEYINSEVAKMFR